MSKLFLATSFSGHVDYETGIVVPEYRRTIEGILSALRTTGEFDVFCAVEYEGWVISGDVPPEVGVQKDLAEIDEADIVLAVLPTGIISAGIQYEVGYADAKGTHVVLATEKGTELAYFNQGVVALGRVAHIAYESSEDLALQMRTA